MVEEMEELFPRLRGTDYQITSPPDAVYNCISWAVGEVKNWWWPAEPAKTYWPAGVPRMETLDAFCAALATLGYVVCDHAEVEQDYVKIALYADAERVPTHAARQLLSGRWTSKLGRMEDLEHALHDLEGALYGSVTLIMKRPLSATEAAQQ